MKLENHVDCIATGALASSLLACRRRAITSRTTTIWTTGCTVNSVFNTMTALFAGGATPYTGTGGLPMP